MTLNPGSFQPPLFGQDNLVAIGTDLATAFPLIPEGNIFRRVDPGAMARLPGTNQYTVSVYNLGDNDLTVAPGQGDRILPLAIGETVTVPAGASIVFVTYSTPLEPVPHSWVQQNQGPQGSVGPIGPSGGVSSVATHGSGISGGPITATGTLSVQWNAGAVSTVSSGLSLASGVLTGSWQAAAVTALGNLTNTSGILSAPSVTPLTAAAHSLLGNPGSVTATPSSIELGAGLTLSAGGTLSAPSAGDVFLSGLPVAGQAAEWVNGAAITGVDTTGSGDYVKSTSAALVTPDLGTPTAINLSNATNMPATGITGRLAFANLATVAATSLLGNATGAGASAGNIAIGTGLTLVGSPGTLSATGGVGSVTQVVAQGGPFLANGTITSSGTINNSTASLTPHGVIVAEGTGAAVATAAGTDGQLLIATTSADPAFASMSGDATITKAGVITVTKIGGVTPPTAANTGVVLNSGTVQAELSVTLAGTAGSTLTIAPGTGTKVSVINLAASGGTQTLAYAGVYNFQSSRIHLKQGATVSAVVLNTGTVGGFIFGTSGGPTSFTVTATVGAIDEIAIEAPTTGYARVMAIAQGFTA